jgi:hypothetical protein
MFIALLMYLPVMDTCYTIADPIIGGVYIPPVRPPNFFYAYMRLITFLFHSYLQKVVFCYYKS